MEITQTESRSRAGDKFIHRPRVMQPAYGPVQGEGSVRQLAQGAGAGRAESHPARFLNSDRRALLPMPPKPKAGAMRHIRPITFMLERVGRGGEEVRYYYFGEGGGAWGGRAHRDPVLGDDVEGRALGEADEGGWGRVVEGQAQEVHGRGEGLATRRWAAGYEAQGVAALEGWMGGGGVLKLRLTCMPMGHASCAIWSAAAFPNIAVV